MKLKKFLDILVVSSLVLTAVNNSNANTTNNVENNTTNVHQQVNTNNDNIGFTVFSVLVGEIALDSGQLGLSSDVWSNLAVNSKNSAALERATEIAMANNQVLRVLNLTNQWLAIDPKNEKAADIQHSILFLSQKFEDLLSILQKRLALYKNQPEEQKKIILAINKLLHKTNGLFTNATTKENINKFVVELSKNYENFAETQLLLANSFFILGDKENTIKHLKNAVSIDKNNEQALLLLTSFIFKDFPRESENFLSEFLQNNPNSISVRSALFEVFLSHKKYDEAYKQSMFLLQQDNISPNVIFALAIKASTAYSENEFAIKLLNTLLQTESVKDNILLANFYNFSLAEIQIKSKLEIQAIDTLYKVKYIDENQQKQLLTKLQNNNKNSNSSNNEKEEKFINEFLLQNNYLNSRILLAELLAGQNKTSQAKAILQNTLVNTNNNDNEKIALVIAQAQIIANDKTTSNNEQQAYLFLKNTLKNEANKNFINDADFLYQLAIFAGQNNKNSEMESLLKRLIKQNPEHYAGLNALGYYYVDANIKNKFKLAEQYILKALAISNNKDAYIIDSLGWLYYRSGDFSKAYEHLNFAYSKTKEVEIGVHLLQLLQILKNKVNDETNQQKYAEEFDKVYDELNTNFANDKIFIKYKNKSKKFQKK